MTNEYYIAMSYGLGILGNSWSWRLLLGINNVGPTCQLKQNKKIKRSNPLPLGFLDGLTFQYGERLGCWPGHNENIKKKIEMVPGVWPWTWLSTWHVLILAPVYIDEKN